MPRTLLLLLTLLLSAAWLQAQEYPSQTGSSHAGTHASGQTSVEGCLQGSNGNYTLTDKSGTTYQLEGDSSKLSEHVGHEVRIMGTSAAASATGSSMGAQAGGSQQSTITVHSVKHISTKCQSAAGK